MLGSAAITALCGHTVHNRNSHCLRRFPDQYAGPRWGCLQRRGPARDVYRLDNYVPNLGQCYGRLSETGQSLAGSVDGGLSSKLLGTVRVDGDRMRSWWLRITETRKYRRET